MQEKIGLVIILILLAVLLIRRQQLLKKAAPEDESKKIKKEKPQKVKKAKKEKKKTEKFTVPENKTEPETAVPHKTAETVGNSQKNPFVRPGENSGHAETENVKPQTNTESAVHSDRDNGSRSHKGADALKLEHDYSAIYENDDAEGTMVSRSNLIAGKMNSKEAPALNAAKVYRQEVNSDKEKDPKFAVIRQMVEVHTDEIIQ